MTAQYSPETPLVSTTEKDEADPLFIPDAKINMAQDKEVRAWIDENLLPTVKVAEDDGIPQREEWQAIRDMIYLKHGPDQAYIGESNVYLPTYAKASDSRTSHINRALFPTDSVVDVISEDGQGDADAMKCWMQYQLETEAKLRLNMKKHVRTLNDFGFAVSKVYWHKPPQPQSKVKLQKILTQGLLGGLASDEAEGMRFLPRDIFAFYVWPTTIDNIDQASLVFEAIQVSKQDADLRFKSKEWLNQEEAGFPDASSEYLVDLQEETSQVIGTTATSQDAASKGELGTWGVVKECWLRMPISRALYGPAEVPGCPVPVKVVLLNGVPVQVVRNPYWHQKPPYVVSSLAARPAQIYGTGLGKPGLQIQSVINDTMNQTQDNVTYGLNPMAVINPTQLVGTSNVSIKPGGVINTLDPNSVKWDRPPVEQMQYGNQQLATLMGMMNDLLGTPPIMQGTSSRGAAKTATGSQILQNNVKTDLQDIVDDLELSVLIPTMEMAFMLGQQYEKNDRWIAVTGAAPIHFTRDAFLGRYKFRWLASSQTENRQVRAQQALAFLAQIVNPAVLQLLMQHGKMVNPEPLLKIIYNSAVGGRDFDKILMPMQPQIAQPGQPVLGPGGQMLPPGGQIEDPRSAVEQAPGGSGEMAPGEGEDFMMTRQAADEEAAQLGATYGETE